MKTLNDELNIPFSPNYKKILAETEAMGFGMGSDVLTGNFLRMLVASKSGGRFLEMGTGTGLAACWMLDGMDAESSLVSVDNAPACLEIARKFLGNDRRLTLVREEGNHFIAAAKKRSFDLVFADSWPDKYENLEPMLDLVAPGGFYVIDDMLPQPNWIEGHQPLVDALLAKLESLEDFRMVKFSWSTGVVVCVRKSLSAQ